MMLLLIKDFDDRGKALAEKFWPGPLTVIFKRSDLVPKTVSAGLDTVAIRMPSNVIANKLISLSNLPIAAPSANLSGSPSPTCAKYVVEDLDGRVDMILNSYNSDVGLESTVISLATQRPRLLRPGFVTPEQIMDVIGEIEIDKAVSQSIENDAVVNAPGMKYKHYAPKAKVFVVEGSFDKFKAFVAQKKNENVIAMCFDGEEKELDVKCVEYGKEEDSVEQASKLFESLRIVDEMGAKTVYARCPSCKGVGLAVTNRLFKAAGFEVIRL